MALSLDDVVFRQAISTYLEATMLVRSVFVESGAAEFDTTTFNGMPGPTVSIRHWNEYDGDDEVNDGSTASTPQVLSDYTDIGIFCRRKKAFGVAPVVEDALGREDRDTVQREIVRQNVLYWPKKMDVALIKVLTGQFASGGQLASTHLNDIAKSSASDPKAPASFGDLSNTLSLLGDNANYVGMYLMHSLVWNDLLQENSSRAKEEYITIELPGLNETQRVLRATYAGRPVFVSDSVPTEGSGAYKKFYTFAIAPKQLVVGLQTDIQIFTGVEPLVPRRLYTPTVSFVPHNRGVAWTGAGDSVARNPTNANLAAVGNWSKVAANKEIRIVALKSNALNAA